jgi:serine phosphatase RsbU (regulator of sigma subunit)
LADVLAYCVQQSLEKKSLTGELLDRYREINLFYHLSEALMVSPEPSEIAATALEKIESLVHSEGSRIFLASQNPLGFTPIASRGVAFGLVPPGEQIERVWRTGKAELSNFQPADEIFEEGSSGQVSILCAPVKTEKQTLGVVLLASPGEKGYDAGDLKLLSTIARQVAITIEISRFYQQAVENARIEQEVIMARQVQESLLPSNLPDISGWSFAQRWQPARGVSGDFYDVIQEKPGSVGFLIGDVTDKGLPASLFMVFVRSAIRSVIGHGASLKDDLQLANQIICRDSREGLFSSLFYLRLQPEPSTAEFVNAGHTPGLYYSAEEGQITLLRTPGLPLGVESEAIYRQGSVKFTPGDVLLLYTDGVNEAVNPQMEEFGLERLQNIFYEYRAEPPDRLLEVILNCVTEFARSSAQFDDITMLIVKKDDPGS